MNDYFFKVITASAGTGKTYRLSLEYIRIIIEYSVFDEFHYSQILAITFTKKATAEIKERIFQHLESIYCDNEQAKTIITNLERLMNRKITNEEILNLKSTYLKMLLNKQDVHISTIDSFAGSIFKSVIAPWKGINEFELDLKYNEKILPQIMETLLKQGMINEEILSFLNTELRIRPDQHTKDLSNLIDNRWQLYFLNKFSTDAPIEELKLAYYKYNDILSEFLELFKQEYDKKGKSSVRDYIKQGVKSEFPYDDIEELLSSMKNKFTDLDYLKQNYKSILDNIIFYNGAKLRSTDLKEASKELITALADLLYYYIYFNEWIEIKNFWNKLVQEYDKIKLSSGKLTYSDITDYTFNYLFDEELSIIDQDTGTVTNRFYEALSYRTRFLLLDEFQDTSIVQYKLFQPMIDELVSGSGIYPYGGVIIVGDEKQAIYQWRSGEMNLILKLSQRYKVVNDRLDTCYRSANSIIDFINNIFSSSEMLNVKESLQLDWSYDNVECAREEIEGKVSFKEYTYNNGEGSKQEGFEVFVNEYLISFIETDSGYNCKGIAVIARTNKELTAIADILTQSGISYVQESNNPLFKHNAIKPILFLMDWIVYGDRLSLLKFYRSDAYLLSSHDMKTFIGNSHTLTNDEFNEYLLTLPGFNTIESLRDYVSDPFMFSLKVMERFNFINLFPTDNEQKNLDKFLNIAYSFAHDRHEYANNLQGFLLYCHDTEKDEANRQETVIDENAITLISIHKSKGLAFKTVFFYSSLGTGNRDIDDIFVNYQFDDQYNHLLDYHISMRCKHILKKTSVTDVVARKAMSNEIQELNANYVALTRAEDNLFLFYSVKLVKGGVPGADSELSMAIYNSAKELISSSETFTNPSDELDIKNEDVKNVIDISEYFNPDKNLFREKLDESDLKNKSELEALYITGKRNIIGTIVHHYLSFIEYDEDRYHKLAYKQTIATYGNLIVAKDINTCIGYAKAFITDNPELYSRKWDKVFNEFTIYHPVTGQEFRIDRLQISENHKKIVIIDYKTGSINDKDQLENYKEIVESIPYIKKGNYSIETEYVKVEVL